MSAPLFCRCVRQGLCRFDKGWIDACETPQTFVRRETHRRNRVEMAEQWHYFKRIFWWGRLAEATLPLIRTESILKVVPFETGLRYRIKLY